MTSKQIDILIKHGDICDDTYWPSPGIGFCKGEEQTFEASNGIKYCISKEMYNIFYSLFEYNQPWEFGFNENDTEQTVKFNIGLRPKNKEGKLKVLTDLLEIEITNLKKLIGNLTFYNTPDTIKECWFWDFFKQGENIVECLKFEILEGKRLSEFKMPIEKELPNRYKLDRFFETDEMRKIYEVGEISKTIYYLKNAIDNIDADISSNNIDTSKETHRKFALYCFFAGKAASDISVCKEILQHFHSNLKRPVSIKDEYLKFCEFGKFKCGDYKSKKSIEPLIDDIKWTLEYLTDHQKILANITIGELKIKLESIK